MYRALLFGVVLTLAGCLHIPFVRKHRDRVQPPEAVQRFSQKAQSLAEAPRAPALPEVTQSMGAAVEALPGVTDGDQLAQRVRAQADAMKGRSAEEEDAIARGSLETALGAVRRAEPEVSSEEKDKALEVANRAVQEIEPGERATVHRAYREVARAMVVVTGGRFEAAPSNELSQLVARFATDEPDDARRTGAQAIAALADAFAELPSRPSHGTARDLRKRAQRLATASALDYADQLKSALSVAITELASASPSPAARQLLHDARIAVDAIRADRPLELQRPVAQEALRLVADAITVSVVVSGR